MKRRKRSKKTETNPVWFIIAIFIFLTYVSPVMKPATYMTPTDVTYEWFTANPYDSDIRSRLQYKGSIYGNTITVGDYKIVSQIEGQSDFIHAGGYRLGGCYTKFTVYKIDVVIGTTHKQTRDLLIDMNTDEIKYSYDDDGGNIVDSVEVSPDMNYIRVRRAMKFDYCTNCYSPYPKAKDMHIICDATKESVLIHLAESSFDVIVQAPETAYFAGQYIPIDVIVTSKLDGDYKGLLTITYDMATFFGKVQEVQSKYVDIIYGQNIFQYVVPTEKVTERFNVTVKMEVLSTPDTVSGVNDNINKTIARIEFDPQIITLNPLPLTMLPDENGNCLDGYSLNPIGDICVADYLFGLSCYHIGCPIINDSTTIYQCSSAGVCTETISLTVYGKCPNGTVETPTDTGAKICIRTEIYNHIMQCEKNSDCLNPCEGIVPQCVDGKCVYSGECNVITEQEIVEIVKEADIVAEPYIGEIISETVTETTSSPFGLDKSTLFITLILSIVGGLIVQKLLK